MMMSMKSGVAFLCMPKCASTSIEAALKRYSNIVLAGPNGPKHMTFMQYSMTAYPFYKAIFPAKEIVSFCLMREPVSWLESWYRYRTRDDLKDPSHKNHQNYTGNISFSEFVGAYLDQSESIRFPDILSQYDFVQDQEENIGVDYIFDMSDMEAVSEFLSTRFGRDIEIPVKNVSPSFAVSLDDEIRKRLEKRLEKDIALYQFVHKHGYYAKSRDFSVVADLLSPYR